MATGRDIIRVLNARKGFDWWWDDLDAEIKAEIIAELDALPGVEPSPPPAPHPLRHYVDEDEM